MAALYFFGYVQDYIFLHMIGLASEKQAIQSQLRADVLRTTAYLAIFSYYFYFSTLQASSREGQVLRLFVLSQSHVIIPDSEKTVHFDLQMKSLY